MKSRIKGKRGEEIAKAYLLEQGYEFVQSNFFTRYGEVDLIMRKDKDIFFFEVKYRTGNTFGFGEESITPQKIEKLQKTIEIWLSQNHERSNIGEVLLNAIVIDAEGINVFEIL